MAVPVPELNPVEEEWLNWRGEAQRGSGESLYGGMLSDLRSGVLQTHPALQEKTQSWWQIIVPNVFWGKKNP